MLYVLSISLFCAILFIHIVAPCLTLHANLQATYCFCHIHKQHIGSLGWNGRQATNVCLVLELGGEI